MDLSHAIAKREPQACLALAFSQISDFKFEIDFNPGKPEWI
jgi:hypothetical protein